MKKIFLKLGVSHYWIKDDVLLNNNADLYDLHLALDPIQALEVKIEADEYSVIIWSSDSIKKAANIAFRTRQEQNDFDRAYDQYYDKRWNEIPKVKLTPLVWQKLQQKWQRIKEEKLQYVIFGLDDSGEFHKVDLISKNELSQEDLKYMQCEHEEYLRRKRAEGFYNYDHEIIDDIWRSSADSVFDEDIAKYLDLTADDFNNHKEYTKAEIIAELQAKLKRKEPTFLIVHWLSVRWSYQVKDADQLFENLLLQFSFMDTEWGLMISEEKLQDIADRLSLGQEVTFQLYSEECVD